MKMTCCKIVSLFLMLVMIPCASQAAVSKLDDIPEGIIQKSAAVDIATKAFRASGHDPDALPMKEIKACLVCDDGVNAVQWIVSHLVENEAEPYFVSTISAADGALVSTSTANYLEWYDQWESERSMPHLFWEAEDLMLFEELYRSSALLPRCVLPTDSDITIDEAKAIANDTLQSQFGVSEQALNAYRCSAILRADIENARNWYICYGTAVSPTQATVKYQVTIDAQTGAVILYHENK